MTLERLPDGSVRLAQMDEWHLQTLHSIPALADPGDDDAALRRLYPAPFAAGDATEEQQEDWAEIVQPELEVLFKGSLARVAADLRNARMEPPVFPDADDDEENGDDAAAAEGPPETEKAGSARPPREAQRQRPRPPRPAGIRRPVIQSAPEPPQTWQLTVPASHVDDWYRAMNQARLMLSERHEAHRTDNTHIARMFVSGKMEMLVQYELLTALCGWWVDALMS